LYQKAAIETEAAEFYRISTEEEAGEIKRQQIAAQQGS
jgi:hypothetical protein